MKKIIYNNKLKKILIALFVFVLIFNFIFPNFVMAAATWERNSGRDDLTWSEKAIGSIQDIADSIRTNEDGTIRNRLKIKEANINEQTTNLENAVKNQMAEKFPDLDDAGQEKVCKYFKDSKEKIEVSYFLKMTNVHGEGEKWNHSKTEVTINLTEDDIETVLNTSDEEIEDLETEPVGEEDNTITPPPSSAIGQDPDGVTNSGETTSGLDTLTGMMLEPIMEFFTFFVDSIMTIFGNVMTSQNIKFVMQEAPITDGDTGATITMDNEDDYANFWGRVNVKYPNFVYSSEEIFSGNISLLDINFISGSNSNDGWQKIRTTIASWYKALRLFTIIGLLSILIYTGIRIMISASAQDKAKYKERILNWFTAVILVFVMHYLMAFILVIVEEISELLGNINGLISVTIEGDQIETFKTNLIGLARFQMQQKLFSTKVGFFVIYVALVVYTFKFTFLYIKRMLNMAFLTLIAPLVALMYPIEKMDGKAQAFQLWLKDYIYNALLQPMHHLLYYILVSSALTLAAKNPIYGIVAISFISQAERLLKSIFGFGRARGGTVGGIAGAYATGRIVSSMTKFIKNPFHIGDSKNGSGKSKENNAEDEDSSIPLLKDTNIENMLMGLGNDSDFYTDEENDPNIETQEENDPDTSEASNNEKSVIPDSNSIDVNKMTQEYRKLLLESDTDLSKFGFKDEYDRDLQQLLERIIANQEKLKNAKKLGLSEEEIEKINEELIKDKNMLKNGIWASEMPFVLEQMPLQYLDRDKRSSEQISDDILKYMERARDPKYTPEQQKKYLDLANKDMKLLNRRISENTYIDNLRRNGNSGVDDNRKPKNTRLTSKKPLNKEMISDKTKKSRMALGLGNVGKRLIKPAWDIDKDVDVNAEALIKNVAKGTVGLAVGVTAATVQAGISITDGKYNAFEGIASFGAGFAGGSAITGGVIDGVKSLKGTFEQGYHSSDNRKQKDEWEEKQREKYCKDWSNRDDVIRDYNNEYGDKSKVMRERAKEEYVSRGITDFKEQKQVMKFADQLIKEGMSQKEADRIAVATLKYKQELIKSNNYSMVYDQKKRDKYLDAKIDNYAGNKSKTSIRNTHDEFIDYVRKFDKINNT